MLRRLQRKNSKRAIATRLGKVARINTAMALTMAAAAAAHQHHTDAYAAVVAAVVAGAGILLTETWQQ